MSIRRSSLSVLLRIRRQVELRARVALAGAERRRLALEAEIEHASERIQASRETLRGALDGAIDPASLRLAAQGAMVLERRRLHALAEHAAGEPARTEARRQAAGATSDRKAVELLEARRLAEAARRRERAEQASLDEAAARHAGGWG